LDFYCYGFSMINVYQINTNCKREISTPREKNNCSNHNLYLYDGTLAGTYLQSRVLYNSKWLDLASSLTYVHTVLLFNSEFRITFNSFFFFSANHIFIPTMVGYKIGSTTRIRLSIKIINVNIIVTISIKMSILTIIIISRHYSFQILRTFLSV